MNALIHLLQANIRLQTHRSAQMVGTSSSECCKRDIPLTILVQNASDDFETDIIYLLLLIYLLNNKIYQHM